jgi:hypothetical protein
VKRGGARDRWRGLLIRAEVESAGGDIWRYSLLFQVTVSTLSELILHEADKNIDDKKIKTTIEKINFLFFIIFPLVLVYRR